MHEHDKGNGGHGHGHSHHHHGHGHEHPEPMGWEFDEDKLEKLRDPERAKLLPPDRIWDTITAGLPRPPRVLVDLGTGIGFFAIPFAKRMPDGLIYGCDVSGASLVYLREAVRREGVTNIVAVQSEDVRVPLEDGLADVVVMINLHHHLVSRPGTLAECRRLLRPGGRVAVIDWKPIETEKGPPLEYRIDPAEVRAELEAAGFHAVAEHAIMPQHWCLTAQRD